MPSATLPEAMFEDFAAAVAELSERARGVAPELWGLPRAEGKWTPAQEVTHVALGFDAFVRDLRGEARLRLKGKAWQRLLWRWTALPKLLREGRIPHAVRAPREVRPVDRPGSQDEVILGLVASARAFEDAVRLAARTEPSRRVTHPYFGGLSLRDLLRFGAVHTRHHAGFLPTGASA